MNIQGEMAADLTPVTFSDEELNERIQEIFRQMNDYEKLIVDIQQEARKFHEENEQLKENLAAIINENNRLKTQHPDDSLGAFKNDYIQKSEWIYNNLRNQILCINKEKEMYENLWKKTAYAFEKEVPVTSMTKLKTEHSLETKSLKEQLLTLKHDLAKENKINLFLKQNLKEVVKNLERLQKSNTELSMKLNISENERRDLEKCLEESNELNKEQMQKSAESFEKFQESIRVAEEAMAEIAVLMSEKHQMKEECSFLAKTIGEVMENASERIEKDVEALKVRHSYEIERLKSEIRELKNLLQLEKAKTESVRYEAQALRAKMEAFDQENSHLKEDMQSTAVAINQTQKKFLEMQKSLEQQQKIHAKDQLSIDQLQKKIKNHDETKGKYNLLLVQLAKKLEEKTKFLVQENYRLKDSNKKKRGRKQ